MTKILITILFYCCCTALFAQGWERHYQLDTCETRCLEQTRDSGFVIGFHELDNGIYRHKLMKTDLIGLPLWEKTYNLGTIQKVKETKDGGLIVLSLLNNAGVHRTSSLTKTNANGDSLWTKSFYGSAYDLKVTADSGYVLVGLSPYAMGNSHHYILKTDVNGDSLWSKRLDLGAGGTSTFLGVSELANGGYLATGQMNAGAFTAVLEYHISVARFDANGDTLWTRNYEGVSSAHKEGHDIKETSNGDIIVVGSMMADVMVLKLDSLGNKIWQNSYGGTGFDWGYFGDEAIDGTYMISGIWDYQIGGNGIPNQGDMYLLKLDTSGSIIWDKRFLLNPNQEEWLAGGLVTNDDHYALLGYAAITGDQFLLKVDSLGRTFNYHIVGNVHEDGNVNCVLDSGEQGLENVLVVAQGSSLSRYGLSDSLGNYSIAVDSGQYTVSAVLSPYWQPCAAPSNLAVVNTIATIDTIDWAMEPLVQCPLLQVDLSAPFLRRTGGGSPYTVNYCNIGTMDEPNVVVDLTLDPHLIVLNSSIPIANQVANVYTFNVGQVDQGACGSFQVQVVVDSIAMIGQTHCSEVHIYPDTNCLSTWNGARLTVGAACDNDSVSFQIENIGAAMMQAETYYVYEDNVMFHTGTTNVLGPGGTQVIKHAATPGKTYRLTVNQANGFPPILGDTVATVAIEGCLPFFNGLFNTGYVTQFSNGNRSPFIAVDCQPSIAAYDPNDKSAQPVGYGSSHYIYKHTDLDYKIRFQNTGNDTAFLVVIRDTLSAHLDPATLIMGASSHPYTWQLSGQGILEVRFENIMLPDSNVNEMASHGFFRFRIQQRANNSIGTIINNQAAIYFDYNPPIITNTTFHTVGENFEQIAVSVDEVENPKVSVLVYPNPFYDFTTIKVLGEEYDELNIKVVDVAGRVVKQDVFENNEYILTKEQLPSGIYFYQLEGDNQLINTGKIIVQ